MRITTHGKNRGRIELVTQEMRTLTKAHSLLCDLESVPSIEIVAMAREAREALDAVLDKLTYKEPSTVDA